MLAEELPFTVFVHQSEEDAYRTEYPNATIVTHDLTGIGVIREAMLTLARSKPFAWMVDDDVRNLFERTDGKLRRVTWRVALDRMEAEVASDWPTVALAGPSARQYAWSGPDRFFNRHVPQVVLINTAAPIDYWPHLLEDIDVVLQALTAGWHTLRWNVWAYEVPQMGTVKGGCWDDYQAGKQEQAMELLLARWRERAPGLVGVRLNKRGYVQTVVRWKDFREPVRQSA